MSSSTAVSVNVHDESAFRDLVVSRLGEFVTKTPVMHEEGERVVLGWDGAGRDVRLEVFEGRVVVRRQERSGSSEVVSNITPTQAARLVARWVDRGF